MKLCSTFFFPQSSLFNSNRGFYKQNIFTTNKKTTLQHEALVLQTETVSRNQCPHSATGFKDTFVRNRAVQMLLQSKGCEMLSVRSLRAHKD